MADPEEGGVDAPANEEGAPGIDPAAIAEIVAAQVAEAIKPLHEDVATVRKNKIDSRNKKLNDENAELKAQIEALTGKVQELSPETADSQAALLQKMREDFAEQVKRSKQIEDQFAAAQSKLRRKELEDLVLADVAPAQRDVALDLMEGTLHRQKINIDELDDLAPTAETLRKRIASTLSVPPDPKGQPKASGDAPGSNADPSKVDWSSYASYEEVPVELRAHIPDDVFKSWVKPDFDGKFGGLRL